MKFFYYIFVGLLLNSCLTPMSQSEIDALTVCRGITLKQVEQNLQPHYQAVNVGKGFVETNFEQMSSWGSGKSFQKIKVSEWGKNSVRISVFIKTSGYMPLKTEQTTTRFNTRSNANTRSHSRSMGNKSKYKGNSYGYGEASGSSYHSGSDSSSSYDGSNQGSMISEKAVLVKDVNHRRLRYYRERADRYLQIKNMVCRKH